MERKKDATLFFLLLALCHVCAIKGQNCSNHKILTDLSCYTDYNRTITCEWNSTLECDTVCNITAKKMTKYISRTGKSNVNMPISSYCLKSVDVSRPALKKCLMIFKKDEAFSASNDYSINLTCNAVKVTNITFKPFHHIKLDPPQKPEINVTTVSWIVKKRDKIRSYNLHFQWKHEDQSWKEASEQKTQNIEKLCGWKCSAEVWLIEDKKYEVRVRVKALPESRFSVWSDWSPSAVVSPIRTPNPPSDGPGVIISIVACLVVAALLLAVIHLKRNKTIWIYMITKIKGQPIPNPAKSFLKDVNFQNHLSPHFPNFFNPLKITTEEITSSVDVFAPCRPEVALLQKMRSKSSNESSSSSFSNPSYAHLCPPPAPPASLLTTGNLDPCAADTPYGPVCSKNAVEDTEQERSEIGRKKREILELLSKGSNERDLAPVMSDYEKIEKLQVERSRLQSLDSGVCSSEEVSQESLEADSINMTENYDGQVERETGKAKEHVFQELFGGAGDIFGKGSIQVCSGYEPAQNLKLDSPELQSLDLGVRSEGDGQFSQEESLENADKPTESTNLLFPLSSSTLSCTFSSITPLPLNLAGQALSPAMQPLQCNILQRLALMSATRSAEPSGDGYMPVRQEQS
ncbi:uncharacterized protein [Labrus bergylta]|uniref:uncharacterized protein isoform X2 n=1 Tax=Labrus bergylta TaxID=56723 RepID=UPI0033139321